MLKVCKNCNKEYNARKSKQNFCSRKCTYEYRSKYLVGKNACNYKNGNRTKVKTICDYCGKEIFKEKQHLDKWNKNFCNRNCQIEYYKLHSVEVSGENSPRYSQVEVSCEQCGKLFKTYYSTRDKVRFCSKKCRNNWQSQMMSGYKHYNWNGGKTNWKSSMMAKREYKNWREQVLKRDSYTCQRCGNTTEILHAHHIKDVVHYPDLIFDVSNGLTLCSKCHAKEHTKK